MKKVKEGASTLLSKDVKSFFDFHANEKEMTYFGASSKVVYNHIVTNIIDEFSIPKVLFQDYHVFILNNFNNT